MATLPLGVSISLLNESDFRKSLVKEVARHLDRVFRSSVPEIRQKLKEKIGQALKQAPETESLLTGQLRAEMGLMRPAGIIDSIIFTIQDNLEVESNGVTASGESVSGGMSIRFLRANYDDVLRVPGVEYVSEGGYLIQWLRWLLTEGDSFIVLTHEFQPGPFGRTGLGHMVKRNAWKVPAQFSGTVANNWLTRAFTGFEKTIEEVLKEVLQARV